MNSAGLPDRGSDITCLTKRELARVPEYQIIMELFWGDVSGFARPVRLRSISLLYANEKVKVRRGKNTAWVVRVRNLRGLPKIFIRSNEMSVELFAKGPYKIDDLWKHTGEWKDVQKLVRFFDLASRLKTAGR